MANHGSDLRVRALAAAGAGLFALALMAVAAPQASAASVVSCPAVIISCGCTITDAAVHTLGNDLNASQGLNKDGSCVNIRKSFATLDGDDFDVDGAGSGIGIRILKGAKRVSVQNFADIDDWDVGIEDDGGGALISEFGVSDNTTAGVLLKNVQRSAVSGFDALGNGTGVLLQGTKRSVVDAFDSTCDDCPSNGTGVALVKSNNNSIQDFDANANTADGVDLTNSNNNLIISFNAGFDDFDDGNGGNGVTLSHSSKNQVMDFVSEDNVGDGVLVDPHSNNNIIGDASTGDIQENGGNGVEVDAGSKSNSIFFIDSFNVGTDLVDGNTNCDRDVWSNNCFDTESQACIGVLATRC